MSRMKRFSAFLLLTILMLVGCMLISSSPLADLEKEIIKKSQIKVVTVGQYQFGKGGMLLVGQNENGDGALKTYVKIPILNRYMQTYEVRFTREDQPLYIAGESWDGYQVLIYQDGKLNKDDDPSDLGFAGRIPLWITIAALVSLLITFGPNWIHKRKKSE